MPEENTPPPAGAAAPPTSGGTSTLLDDLETQLGPGAAQAGGEDGEGTPPPPNPAVATPPAAQMPPKLPEGQTPPKQVPPKPQPKPAPVKPAQEPVKEKDPVALRKRLQEVETELSTFKGTATQEKASLEAKLSDLSKKRFWTPEDEQRNTAIQKRLQEVEAQFYARDYAESPEFKEKFEKPWQKRHTEAIEDVKGMTIKTKTADGEDSSRPATATDWFKVLNAPSSGDARRIAKEIFGEDAADVLAHRSTLKAMEQTGKDAIDAARTNFDTMRQKAFEESQKNSSAFNQQRESFSQALVQKYPAYFSEEGASEEEKAALKGGLDFVRQSLEQAATLPPEEHAKRAAVMALYAGAFPRLIVTNKALKAQIEDLNTRLAAFQKTDPGNAGEGGSGGGGGTGSGSATGTNKLMEAFLDIPKE